LRILSADLTRITTSGLGTLRDPDVTDLRPRDTVSVTDEGADTVEAEVLAVRSGEVDVLVHWGRVLHGA
jgi:hypothetical protein